MALELRRAAQALAGDIRVIPLGGDADFEKRFLAAMDFPGA